MGARLKHHEKLGWAMAKNSPKLLDRHPLANGLTLEFWDHSRPLVRNRWFVRLEARIAIPLGPRRCRRSCKPTPPWFWMPWERKSSSLRKRPAILLLPPRPRACFGICKTGFWPWLGLFRAWRFRPPIHPEKIRQTAGTAAVAAFRYQGRPGLTDLTPALPCSILLNRLSYYA